MQWISEIRPEIFDQEVLKCPGTALVVFLKKGVASGDMFTGVLERLARESKGKILFFKADIEGCSKIAARYRIVKIPTTLVFRKGKVVNHFVGMMSARKLKMALDAVA